MTVPKVLVTGAGGFVGEALVFRILLDKRFAPVAAARGATRLQGLCAVVPFDLNNDPVIPSLDQIRVVVHAAARVHVMNDTASDALAEFRKVNVSGTIRLARLAAEAGVKRFVFISSIKVNGESTPLGQPFKAEDTPSPIDPYAISKWEAEQALRQLADQTGMEVVIIRPPLVYGPGVKANFLSMLNWLEKGVPLPLGAINNRRSLVSIANLIDLLVTCIEHPAAANQTFLVSDDEDVSTTQLLKGLGGALGKKTHLLPLPEWLLMLAASVAGKQSVAQRIFGTLQVDISKTRDLLGWVPPVSLDKALRKTAQHYLESKKT
ncbi:N-acetyl-alpha-D-glucosaminyl-diphospho-ditrans, octacis-undecaprenol 4-epimerase [Pseudomonas fluorescens]|uniref:N-acetyl-alpha-D-glucosaminyl-diphospho-ditrans, octacis-undecaprenol 4-epimerase n=1 Tax=Pseudomonas fluorescens TaxID=294 RepID=A0A5E7D3H9_PSEFL|nr:SDR family oxidoreductase [Pseudomonas fluorescens]VVO02142.1 N-acetyl-alpha-D-glucosaminyl-diphospho-ditrans, octacis-undecaprenol 4-epimerase [Pseudomonas fluorescens]